ncbi:Phosphoenolpyruvate carboxykinase [ATP] [Raoultella terrigena]|uniref:Phosphoenolpyruvate carboxykinase [ATP] n=1 Tax=Raoultella terrigena TaxID=577 RepID=A0A4U9CWR6_RAOTE|nr:Phosphoenolpyruvate carboxykinase [ATP] [Raoultella terrigena]
MPRIELVKQALHELGIKDSSELFYNPDYDLLIAHETSPELTGAARGVMTASGAVAVDTGYLPDVHRVTNISSEMT